MKYKQIFQISSVVHLFLNIVFTILFGLNRDCTPDSSLYKWGTSYYYFSLASIFLGPFLIIGLFGNNDNLGSASILSKIVLNLVELVYFISIWVVYDNDSNECSDSDLLNIALAFIIIFPIGAMAFLLSLWTKASELNEYFENLIPNVPNVPNDYKQIFQISFVVQLFFNIAFTILVGVYRDCTPDSSLYKWGNSYIIMIATNAVTRIF